MSALPDVGPLLQRMAGELTTNLAQRQISGPGFVGIPTLVCLGCRAAAQACACRAATTGHAGYRLLSGDDFAPERLAAWGAAVRTCRFPVDDRLP